jgi:hypothetical protein
MPEMATQLSHFSRASNPEYARTHSTGFFSLSFVEWSTVNPRKWVSNVTDTLIPLPLRYTSINAHSTAFGVDINTSGVVPKLIVATWLVPSILMAREPIMRPCESQSMLSALPRTSLKFVPLGRGGAIRARNVTFLLETSSPKLETLDALEGINPDKEFNVSCPGPASSL